MSELSFIPNNGANQPQGTPDLSPESITNRLNMINNYIDQKLPGVIEGLNDADIEYQNKYNQASQFIPKLNNSTISELQTNVSGDALIPPALKLKSTELSDSLSFAKNLSDQMKYGVATSSDPFYFAKPTSFNASRFGQNYERYYASNAFKKLGFNLYRDNETLYNQNTTYWDDFSRMGVKFFSLAGGAISGTFKNWGKFGSMGSAEEAAAMEHDLSIATSTKGGFGAWTINFLGNSAYTVGTIAEMVLENAAIAAIAGLTRNPAIMSAAIPRNAMKLKQMTKALNIMAKTLKNPSKARSFYTAAKGLGNSVLPFQEFRSFASTALNPNSAFHRMDNVAKAARGFGSFYRGMAEINAVTAESRLEGGFVQNRVATEATKEFIKKNKRNPTLEESEEIYKKAVEAGTSTTIGNVPVIYFSNKLVFDTAFRSFKPINKLLNQGSIKSAFYKIVENPNWKKAGGNPYDLAKKVGLAGTAKKLFSLENLKNIPSKLTFGAAGVGAKKTIGNTLRYFNNNLAEGLQELYQEGLQEGVSSYYLEEYYSELYKDPIRAANNTFLRAASDGFMSQMNSQGLDVFLSGFLMGGVMQPVQSGIVNAQRASMRVSDYINKTNKYEEFQDSERKRMEGFVNTLNEVTKNPKAYARWIDENIKLQRDMAAEYDQAEELGDRKLGEDAKQDSLFSHVYTLAATGKLDILEEQLSSLKNLSAEELAEAFNEEHEDSPDFNKNIQSRLDNVIKKVGQVKKRYDRVSTIQNPFNPDYFDEKTNPSGYYAEQLGYDSFEKAKMMLAFNEYTFDRSMDRIESLLNEASLEGPLGNVAASDFAILYSTKSTRDQYVKTLLSEIESYKGGSKEDVEKAERLNNQLQEFISVSTMLANYRGITSLIEKAKVSPKALQELKDLALKISPNLNIVDDITGQQQINFEQAELAPDVIVSEYYKDLVKDSYTKYTKLIAQNNDVYTGEFNIDSSLDKLLDHSRLDVDARSASDFINMMTDPLNIMRMAEKIKTAHDKIQAKATELHKEALENFMNKMNLDDFFQKLFELGVYFKPEYIDDFINNDIIPKEFLDAVDGSTIVEGDEKYDQIINLITSIEKLRGKTFSGKPVPTRQKEPTKTKETIQEEKEEKSTTETSVPTESSKVEMPEQYAENPLEIYTPEVASRLQAAFEKRFPDPTNRPDIAIWISDSPIAASIINGVGKEKITVDIESITDIITPKTSRSIISPTPATEPLYKTVWALVKGVYNAVINGEKTQAKRVSSLLPKDIKADTRFSIARGNFIDDIIREFASPLGEAKDGLSLKDSLLNAISIYNKTGDATEREISKVQIKNLISVISLKYVNDPQYSINISDGFADDMFNVLEQLAVSLKDFIWYPKIPTIAGTIRNETYAGTIDLLLEKEGKFYLIDIKSSVLPRRGLKDYYEDSDLVQQNAYAELIKQNSMIDVDRIEILNFITRENKETKTLNGISLDYHVPKDKKEETVFYNIPKQPIEEILNRILGPLPVDKASTSGPTPVTPAPVSDVKAKKADIERRRQEELESSKKDVTVKIETYEGVYQDTGETHVVTVRTMEDGTKIIQEKVKGEKTPMAPERIKGDQLNLPIENFTTLDKGSLTKISEQSISESKLKNRINANYDAELAALEGTPTETPVVTEEVTETDTTKASAPTRFKGKLIYAEPGSVDPSVFRQYDVVNADEILATIATNMGVQAVEGLSIYQTIYKSPFAEDIYKEFRNKVKDLLRAGSTVITTSFSLKDMADVKSSPARSEFKFFSDAKSEEESLQIFDKWVNQNANRKAEYDNTQNEGWESVSQSLQKGKQSFEATTNKTVKELFEINQLPSTFVYKMQQASTIETLKNLVSVYFTDPSNKRRFFKVTTNGERVLLSLSEVKALYNNRLDQLFKSDKNIDSETIMKAKEFFDTLNKEDMVSLEITMTPEDKKSAQDAIDSSSAADLVSMAKKAHESAKNSTQKEINEEFYNNLDCE